MNTMSVRRATRADAPVVTSILAAAFENDPIALWVLGGRPDPSRDLQVMFGAMVRETLRQSDHHVHLTDDLSGAAIWLGPERWKMGFGSMVRLFPTALRTGFGGRRAMSLNAATQKAHPRGPHFYLEMIGTRPERQGHGVGSALVRTLTAECDAVGVGSYLESSNPVNIPFYHRHGFEQQEAFPLPPGCPAHTPMWREVRSAP